MQLNRGDDLEEKWLLDKKQYFLVNKMCNINI